MATVKEMLKNFYENGDETADATLFVHGQEMKVHKLILSARSDMFKAMFVHAPDAEGRYPINDPQVTVQEFKDFVKFLYTDEIVINYDNKAAFLRLSDMYFVPFLEQKCLDSPNIVTQEFIHHPLNEIVATLVNILETAQAPKALIFVNTDHCDVLALYLNNRGISVGSLSSARDANHRERTIRDFQNSRINVICCEEDSGINVKDIDLIINFDLPANLDTYKMRIGHHGRFDEIQRRSITYVQTYQPILDEIAAMMREHRVEVPEVLNNFIGGH